MDDWDRLIGDLERIERLRLQCSSTHGDTTLYCKMSLRVIEKFELTQSLLVQTQDQA
jgi:hypothetical protein